MIKLDGCTRSSEIKNFKKKNRTARKQRQLQHKQRGRHQRHLSTDPDLHTTRREAQCGWHSRGHDLYPVMRTGSRASTSIISNRKSLLVPSYNPEMSPRFVTSGPVPHRCRECQQQRADPEGGAER